MKSSYLLFSRKYMLLRIIPRNYKKLRSSVESYRLIFILTSGTIPMIIDKDLKIENYRSIYRSIDEEDIPNS
jgi:hypothetical protein